MQLVRLKLRFLIVGKSTFKGSNHKLP